MVLLSVFWLGLAINPENQEAVPITIVPNDIVEYAQTPDPLSRQAESSNESAHIEAESVSGSVAVGADSDIGQININPYTPVPTNTPEPTSTPSPTPFPLQDDILGTWELKDGRLQLLGIEQLLDATFVGWHFDDGLFQASMNVYHLMFGNTIKFLSGEYEVTKHNFIRIGFPTDHGTEHLGLQATVIEETLTLSNPLTGERAVYRLKNRQ